MSLMRSNTGRMRPVFDIINDMNQTMLRVSPSRRQQLFRELRGRRGAEILMSAMHDNPEQVERIRTATPTAGQDYIARTVAELQNDASGRFLQTQVDQMVNFTAGGNDEAFISTVTSLIGPLTELQTRYPLLSEALGIATTAVGAFTAALVMRGILGGGGVAGALGRGGSALAGAPAAAGGVLPFLGAAGAGLAIGAYIPLDEQSLGSFGVNTEEATRQRRASAALERTELAGRRRMIDASGLAAMQ